MRDNNGVMWVSKYGDSLAMRTDAEDAVSMLSVAFPKQEQAFFVLAAKRMLDNGFTARRMRDAVNYLIDNFQYKELNIADIIKFDKRVKLYGRSEAMQWYDKNVGASQTNPMLKYFKLYKKEECNGEVMYALWSDLAKNGWNVEPMKRAQAKEFNY